MSDEQIATALGQIIGKLDALQGEFHSHLLSDDERHSKINTKLDEHSAHINQQRGAKAVVLTLAGIISAAVAYLVERLW